MLPRATAEHYAQQTRQLEVVLAGIARIWRRMRGRRWETAWHDDVGPQMVDLVQTAQETSAAGADAYMTSVLAELGIPTEVPTQLNIPAFAGAVGDGRSVESDLYGGVIAAVRAQYSPEAAGMTARVLEQYALNEAAAYIEEVTTTILADAARAAETAAMAERPWIDGYVRMLDPKNPCSRCIILAGHFYRWNKGFDRHPKCRCVHIPASEALAHDVLTNPNDYFHSLSKAEQDRVFTNAGAEAIRLGADIRQVVNARRGMHTAQQNPGGSWIPKGRMTPVDVNGRKVFVTSEGVTKRGLGRRAMGKDRPFRLMPESILAIAEGREDAIRLLKLYGFLRDR